MVGRQPGFDEQVGQLGREHFVGFEQLGVRRDRTAGVELCADLSDLVGEFHRRIQVPSEVERYRYTGERVRCLWQRSPACSASSEDGPRLVLRRLVVLAGLALL